MTTIAATRTKRTQTDAEIVALSTTIRAGLAAAAEMKAGSVPAAKRKKLCALVEEGKRAKAEFVEANLGLAYKAANSRPSVVRGIENVEDVVQNGVMGLCRVRRALRAGAWLQVLDVRLLLDPQGDERR